MNLSYNEPEDIQDEDQDSDSQNFEGDGFVDGPVFKGLADELAEINRKNRSI